MADPVTIGLGVAALGYGVYSGEQQKQQQQEALRRTREAQQQAQANAVSAMRKQEAERRTATRQTPDIGSLLAFEQGFKPIGGGSPAPPPDPLGMRLGRTDLLGAP